MSINKIGSVEDFIKGELMNKVAQEEIAAAGVADNFFPWVLQKAGDIASLAPSALEKEVEYGEKERDVDVFTSATGMPDEVYEDIISELTQTGVATTPQALQLVKNMADKLPIDWGDPRQKNIILGLIKRVNMNGGSIRANEVVDKLANFIQGVMGNPGFNMYQMLEIIGSALTMSVPPDILQAQSKVFLDNASMNLGDPMSVMGGGAMKSLGARNQFNDILMSIFEAPDEGQAANALSRRMMTGYGQDLWRAHHGIRRRISPHVLNSLVAAGQLYRGVGNYAQDYSNPINNALWYTIGKGAQAGSYPYYMVGLPSQPLGGQGYFNMNPAYTGVGTASRVAKNKKRFVKIGEKNNKKLIKLGQAAPEFLPQQGYGARAYGSQFQAAGESMSAVDRQIAQAFTVLKQKTDAYTNAINYRVDILKYNISQFTEGMSPGELLEKPVSDLGIIENVNGMSEEISNLYNVLIEVYQQSLQMARQQVEMAYVASGGGGSFEGAQSLYTQYIAGFESEINKVLYERDKWLMQSKVLSNILQQKAQEALVSDTLRQQSKFLEKAYGATTGRLPLSASLAQEAYMLWEAADKLEGVDPERAAAYRARARQMALSKATESVENLDRASVPTVPYSGMGEMLGIE